MSENLTLATPQDAYEWAQQNLTAKGRFQAKITGEGIQNPTWYLLTSGRFCILSLPKQWGRA